MSLYVNITNWCIMGYEGASSPYTFCLDKKIFIQITEFILN